MGAAELSNQSEFVTSATSTVTSANVASHSSASATMTTATNITEGFLERNSKDKRNKRGDHTSSGTTGNEPEPVSMSDGVPPTDPADQANAPHSAEPCKSGAPGLSVTNSPAEHEVAQGTEATLDSTSERLSFDELKVAVIEFMQNYKSFAKNNRQFLLLDDDLGSAFDNADAEPDVRRATQQFGDKIGHVMRTIENKRTRVKKEWTTKFGVFLTKLYPVARLSVRFFAQKATFLPLKGMAVGLGLILQILETEANPNLRKDFLSQLRHIEFQAALLADNPNYDLESEISRNLVDEKSTQFLTAIIKFFNSALIYLSLNFSVNLSKPALVAPEIYEAAKQALNIAIREYIHSILHLTVRVMADWNQKQRDDEFLRWLSPSHWLVEGQLNLVRQQRGKETLQWTLDMAEFQYWLLSELVESSKDQILWIRGTLGIGKSIMAGFFIELLKCQYPNAIVAYFFCRCGQAGLTRARDIIRTIAYQCSENDTSVRSALEELKSQDFRISEDVGVECLFERLLVDPLRRLQKEIYLVLDGLDEADLNIQYESDRLWRSEMAVLLNCLTTMPSSRLLFISRASANVSAIIPNVIIKSVGKHENQEDINMYVSQVVARSRKLQTYFEMVGIDPLQYFDDHCNGIFLWVVLVIRQLEKARSNSVFRKDLQGFSASGSIHSLYCTILSRFDDEDQKWIREILRWVVMAKAILSVQELRRAVEWSLQDTRADFEMFLEVECGSILHLMPSPDGLGVGIVHETFRSFVFDEHYCPQGFFVDEIAIHGHLALICLQRLSTGDETFIDCYGLSEWVYHLSRTTTGQRSEKVLISVHTFFSSEGVRIWIRTMARGTRSPNGDLSECESYLRTVYSWLKTWCIDLEEKSTSEEAAYDNAVEWLQDVVAKPEMLDEYLGKAAVELWLYEDLPLYSVEYIFHFAVKKHCWRTGQYLNNIEELKSIAASKFSTLVEDNPIRDLNRQNLGVACIFLHEWNEAITYLGNLPDSRSTSVLIDQYLALAYIEVGNYDGAIDVLNIAMVSKDVEPWTWRLLGIAHQVKGNVKKAIEAFQIAVAQEGSPWTFIHLGCLCAAQGDSDGEIRTYTSAVEAFPNQWWAWQMLSAAYRANGDIENSVSVCSRALKSNPDEDWAFNSLQNAQQMESLDCTKPTNSPVSEINFHEPGSTTAVPQGTWTPSEAILHDQGPMRHSVKTDRLTLGSLPVLRRFTQQPPESQTGGDYCGWLATVNTNFSHYFQVSLQHSWMHMSAVCCVAFSKNGEFLATGSYRSTKIFELRKFMEIATLVEENAGIGGTDVVALCFSPSGEQLASATTRHDINIWDIEMKVVLKRLAGHENTIHSINISPSGRFMVSGSSDGTVRLWDLESSNDVRLSSILSTIFDIETGDATRSVTFSPDGRLIAFSTDSGALLIFNAEYGALLERLVGHDGPPLTVAFSPNGRKLVSAYDRTVKFWELSNQVRDELTTGAEAQKSKSKKSWISPSNSVRSVDWSPDGKWVLSADDDGCIQFWDEHGQIQFVLFGHHDAVLKKCRDRFVRLAHAPEGAGMLFATVGSDRTARIWQYEIK